MESKGDQKMSTATFYPNVYGSNNAVHVYEIVSRHIIAGIDFETTQMCLLNDAKNYDLIRIVNGPDDVIEIFNRHDGTYDCDRTDKEIRYVHNFTKMWESGVFNK